MLNNTLFKVGDLVRLKEPEVLIDGKGAKPLRQRARGGKRFRVAELRSFQGGDSVVLRLCNPADTSTNYGFWDSGRFELVETKEEYSVNTFQVGDIIRYNAGEYPIPAYKITTEDALCEVLSITEGRHKDLRIRIVQHAQSDGYVGREYDVCSAHFRKISSVIATPPPPYIQPMPVSGTLDGEGYCINISSHAKTLEIGGVYKYKHDPDGTFRVRANGRWNKYGKDYFAKGTREQFETYETHKAGGTSMPTTTTGNVTYSTTTTGTTTELKRAEPYEAIQEAVKPIPEPVVPAKPKVVTLKSALLEQGVLESLIDAMAKARAEYVCAPEVKHRVPNLGLSDLFQGADLWNTCITAILCGSPILLSGGKATGKNTLANSLAMGFGRPVWDVSFHSAIGSDELVGTETFKNNEVTFNPGAVWLASRHKGFVVLDEINMAKDSAIAVLNSMLDGRRVIDVPGYENYRISTEDTVFIGTMNYGYAGTRPLNEALASRFIVPTIVEPNKQGLVRLLKQKASDVREQALNLLADLILDLRLKAQNGEISTASIDLRGLFTAIDMTMLSGMSFNRMLTVGIANKAFEEMERKIVQDVINLKFPADTYFDGAVLYQEEAQFKRGATVNGRQINVKL